MAFTITRLPDSRVMVIRSTGTGSLADSEAVLAELRTLTRPGESTPVLFDVRGLDWVPSAAEAREIGDRYGRVGSEYGYRMAYLAPPGVQFGIARMIEIVSGFRGVAAAAFQDEAEALAWLTRVESD